MNISRLGHIAALVTCVSAISFGQSRPFWMGYGGDAQHTSQSPVKAKHFYRIAWKASMDLQPQYYGVDLLTHYGSPSVTGTGTLLFAVKTGAYDGYRFEAHRAYDGSPIWSLDTGYSLPNHGWTPSVSGALLPDGTYAMPGVGGSIVFRPYADTSLGKTRTIHFYGEDNYNAVDDSNNPLAPQYDAAVKICTPLVADQRGNIFFGYRVEGSTPIGLQSGFVKIDARGHSTYIAAADTVADPAVDEAAMNAAPALSTGNTLVYVAAKRSSSGAGYLVALKSSDLTPVYSTLLKDPLTGGLARIYDDSTSSPVVGPDGKVFFGVLSENHWATNGRGFLLQLGSRLVQSPIAGAFGWDDSPSIVPRRAVPGYTGKSAYLLFCKYNNYAGFNTGDGHNRVALVDPNATALDPVTNLNTMNVVQSVLGPTPDENNSNFPGAVREWCINAAAIDVNGKAAIVNCEDGVLYHWDFKTNTLNESIRLTEGIGEAYTPTLIGKDGTVYAINNASIFAIRE